MATKRPPPGEREKGSPSEARLPGEATLNIHVLMERKEAKLRAKLSDLENEAGVLLGNMSTSKILGASGTLSNDEVLKQARLGLRLDSINKEINERAQKIKMLQELKHSQSRLESIMERIRALRRDQELSVNSAPDRVAGTPLGDDTEEIRREKVRSATDRKRLIEEKKGLIEEINTLRREFGIQEIQPPEPTLITRERNQSASSPSGSSIEVQASELQPSGASGEAPATAAVTPLPETISDEVARVEPDLLRVVPQEP